MTAHRLPRDFRTSARIERLRSIFLADLVRVDDEAAARDVIAAVRKSYPDARHHCSAFVLDDPGAQVIERSNDDGEPPGTAGAPILAVLRGSGLVNIVCVVTRWFGGVKLGTGGLARAYGDATSAVVEGVPRVEVVPIDRWSLTVDHADAGRMTNALLTCGLGVEGSYGVQVTLLLTARAGDDVPAVVSSLTHGGGVLTYLGTESSEQPVS